MNNNANKWIKDLDLLPHPEGGFYKQVHKSEESFTLENDNVRPAYTSIYFLLTNKSPSHLHRLASDEVWYYHDGSPLSVHMIHKDGFYEKVMLGRNPEKNEHLQTVVPKGTIFGSSVDDEEAFALVSCMVSPGFDFQDFELFSQKDLLADFPEHKNIILKLAYEKLPE
ncbi:cupin domain-containing protein [Salipaludibacillus daqingensis]|uniref:cupin domain-containing protein n=1 Tax=Salipaludibacillus daqingensis TaxID=3041001 RepID=UPI00247626DB|nr:cupin domain-containing protein [Salipaludibacillus daqingensis]